MHLSVELDGGPRRLIVEEPSAEVPAGVVGVDVAPRDIDGSAHTVVQVLLDDDVEGFDTTLLDAPLVAEVRGADGAVLARDLFDHDAFRRRLRVERDRGRSVARGVMLLEHGALPPPWVRLAFLPVALADTAGSTLHVADSTVERLRAGIESAHAAGELTDDERITALRTLEHRHPDG